jgi:hypothetical protein
MRGIWLASVLSVTACGAGSIGPAPGTDAATDGALGQADAPPWVLDAPETGGDGQPSQADAPPWVLDAPGTGEDGPPGQADACQPTTCALAGAACGPLDLGCGQSTDCGACPGDLRCGAEAPNQCGTPACVPLQQATTAGGGQCGDLNQAWTARGINVGYYAFRVVAPIEQYSGDYTGPPGVVFSAGGASKGVILQIIQAGQYVGLSSSGPWYNPPVDCFAGASCGDGTRGACADSSPPLRPGIAGFVWGYGYQDASHMQGWIPYDRSRLVFAGFDAGHPCALGPAGVDFEVHSACGAATACSGANPTCGAVNRCDEGADDCGRTDCGAQSGGALTPTAHRSTVIKPSNAVTCTLKTPPHPSVLCAPNGTVVDHFFVYPFGAYLYWGQDSTTKHWLHHGDLVQSYFHTRDSAGVLWDFVEVLGSGAPSLTPASDGAGAASPCSASNTAACVPCKNGGTCGWIQAMFLN